MEGSFGKGVPRIFDAFLTQFWRISDAFWNVPLFPIKQDPFWRISRACHNPEPRSEVWWWNLRWSFGGKCCWRLSPANEARKSPSKRRRKFATNFAENFATVLIFLTHFRRILAIADGFSENTFWTIPTKLRLLSVPIQPPSEQLPCRSAVWNLSPFFSAKGPWKGKSCFSNRALVKAIFEAPKCLQK